jgi:transcriptional regulator with XRE-family HTH domain
MTNLELRPLREQVGCSQSELAKRMQLGSQSTLSFWERTGDLKLSSLVGYIEALGGELTLTIELNGKTFTKVIKKKKKTKEPDANK